jgi:sec-independent protein translocase protein TatC
VLPPGVAVMTDIRHYLDFVLGMFLAFGLAFEVPVAIVLMVRAGAVTPGQLTQNRGYVLLGAFVVGMLLTPPDVLSQTLLSVPLYLLFEVGVFSARILVPGYKEVEAQRRALAGQDKPK